MEAVVLFLDNYSDNYDGSSVDGILFYRHQSFVGLVEWLHVLLPRQSPKLSWGPVIDLADAGVKAPHTAEAGSQCNLAHGQPGFVDEFFRKVDAARLRHCNRRCPQVS